jgi:hypothetical protein
MSNYTFNFAPISFQGKSEILVGLQSYSEDALRESRREFNATHVFQRNSRDNVIIDIPTAIDAKPIGNVHECIDLSKAQNVLSALMSAALIRAFAGMREISSFRPRFAL